MHMEQAIAALRFQPALPVWLLVVLGLLCVAVLAVAAWRRAAGTVWRGIAFAVVLVWLAGPLLVEETRQTLPDIGLLVVDQTASMSVGHRTHLADLARQRIEQEAHGLRDLDLRTITVPEGGSEGTRLFAAIDRALADIPRARLAGIVAITDGQIHDVPPKPPGGVPLHVLLAGKGEETDRRIRVIDAPEYGIVGKSVQLRVAVEDLGVKHGLLDRSPGAARLTIRRDGEPPRIESVPVGRPHVIDVPITRAGPTVIDIERRETPRRRHRSQQPRRGGDQRRARPAARAAGLRRAEPGRTHLAAAAEIRSRRSIWCISPSCARRRKTT